MKTSTQTRRVLLATSLAGSLVIGSSGCSGPGMSLASMNPFSSAPASGAKASAQPSESIATKASGTSNQFRTVSTTAKSALGKTKTAVAKLFGSEADEAATGTADDPLRLDNQPSSVGPEVFVANGQLWESTGNFPKAMESYTKALQSEPNNPPALTSIARLHFRQSRHRKAAEYFQKAIEQSPEDASLHHDLGLSLSKLGNQTAAAESLRRALQLAPGTSRYANSLASVKFESGESEAAYDVLSENNKPAVAHFNMAYLHFKNGQMSNARGHLAQAIKFEPLAKNDSAVKRAVERSREMLAQIDGPISNLGPSEPAATIAARSGGSPNAGRSADRAVRQTSRQTEVAVPASPSGAAPETAVPAGSAGGAAAQPVGSTNSADGTHPGQPESAASNQAPPTFPLPSGFQMPGTE